MDLNKLIHDGAFDAETIENLRTADLDEVARQLGEHLPDDEVEAIVGRIRALLEAAAVAP